MPVCRQIRPAAPKPSLTALAMAAAVLAGCAPAPDLGGTIPPELEAAPYPRLLPLEPILAASRDSAIAPDVEAGLDARAARLRARAAGLRGPVIEPPLRARMARGVPR